jgi:hypothetical protein
MSDSRDKPRQMTMFPGAVIGSREITPKPGDFADVPGDGVAIWRLAFVWDEMVEQLHFNLGQREQWVCIWIGTVEHSHLKKTPAHDAEDRYQVHKPLSRSQSTVLGFEA